MNNHQKMSNEAWHEVLEELSAAPTSQVPDTLLHLVRAIAGVPEPSISCEESEMWLPQYVDDELNGLDVAALYPKVKRHLDVCEACEALYIAMLKWGEVEEAGQLPNVRPKRQPDTSFLPPLSFLTYVREMGDQLVQSLMPQQLDKYQRIVERFFARLNRRGPAFAFEATPILNTARQPRQLLVITYATTQKLVQEWSASHIEVQLKHGTLREGVRQQAQEVARQHGFPLPDAQRFAEQYADLVCQRPQLLHQLS